MNVTVRLIHKALFHVQSTSHLTCRIPQISRLLVRGDDVRAFFTRLQTSTLQCFLQTREPEFTEHCWQPFTKGDETRGNSSTLNALVLQRAASPVFPFRDGTSRYHWCNELDSSAPPRPSAAFVPMVSDVGDSVGNKRLMFLLSKHFALVKVCVPVSAATTTSVEGFPVFPDWAPVNQNKNWEKLLAVFSSFCVI